METVPTNRKIELLNTGAVLSREKGIWKIQVKDGNKTDLPTEFGRNLYTAITLTNGFARKYNGKINMRTWTKAVLSKYQLLVDCHFFTARCLGLEAPFKFRRSFDYTANKKFFPSESYRHQSVEELNREINSLNENVLVGQVVDRNRSLKHSFLIVKIDGISYVIENPGEILIRRSSAGSSLNNRSATACIALQRTVMCQFHFSLLAPGIVSQNSLQKCSNEMRQYLA